MLTFKNHRGQFHKTNTALVALTSLYVIGAAVALSAPYWVSSTSMLAPLAAFAATPLGMSVLAFVAVALICLAVYAISKSNEISELKAWKIVSVSDTQSVLQITKGELKYIEENNKNKDKDGNLIDDEYRIDFVNQKGKEGYVIVQEAISDMVPDITLLLIKSRAMKNDEGGEYVPIGNSKLVNELGLRTKRK
ncbi:hypothetical protein [Wolbachia endosymbiont (group A) of Andrena hattorfiana]|uniref:hypothetical protein n=1 Tax=Wolbachia endosymbiont (group A) of Andrena hattorfiana TaxID=2953977 RepID=UPI0021F8E84A|nr:hypothetical protein [Wolbachia endosymbiont (group A) of Andrena hattorfiana]